MLNQSASKDIVIQALKNCVLFSGVDLEILEELAECCPLRNFEKGSFIFSQGQKADGFYVIVEGQVRIFRTGPDGREQVLHIMGSGEPCGEVPVFQGGKYPASCGAITKVTTVYINGDSFLELAQNKPVILLEMLAVLSVRLRGFVKLIDDLSLKEVSARVAKYLLDLRVTTGSNHIELDSKKTVLASRLGTIAETLSRTLRKMQDRGILEVQGSKITISDYEGLQALAAGMKL